MLMGEIGQHPLLYEACILAIDFLSRIRNSDNDLISAAFFEQVTLELPWHKNISKLCDKYNSTSGYYLKAKLPTQIT
jgi:hypothetical protein